jgi:lysophospholipase L1-like esterase
MRRWLGQGALLFASLLLGAGALEIGVRVVQSRKYGAATSPIALHPDPVTGLQLPTPGDLRGQRTQTHINVLGFRGPELVVPKPHGTKRLAFLGASTTYSAEVSADDKTWPDRVVAGLRANHAGVTLDYVNAAVPGFAVEQNVVNLSKRVAPTAPDAIFYYEATNELSRDTRALAKEAGLVAQLTEVDWLGEYSVAWYLLKKQLDVRSQLAAAREGTGRLTYDADRLASGFRSRLIAFVKDAQAISPVVVLVTFSHKIRRNQAREAQLRASNTSLLYMPYMSLEGLLDGFDAYNVAIRQAAADTGAILIDGEDEIPGDDAHFNDSVHLNDQGCEAMAKRVLSRLEKSEAFQKLLQPAAAEAAEAAPAAAAAKAEAE